MGRKRRKVVVTVTETWTFVFDEAGETPAPPPLDPPALASVPTSPLDVALMAPDAPDAPAVDAAAGNSATGDDA